MTHPLLWVNDPGGRDCSPRTGWRALYDVTDDWLLADRPAASTSGSSPTRRCSCGDAAHVVVCSPALLAAKRRPRRPVDRSSRTRWTSTPTGRPAPRPADLPDGPVALYVGTVHRDRVDLDLCAGHGARAGRTGQLVLVGPAPLDAGATRRGLEEAGVRLLGAARRATRSSATCSTPTCSSCRTSSPPFTDSLDPIKLYEYQAAGRPVVSTPVAGFRDADDPRITIADGPDFAAAVVAAVPAAARFPDGAGGATPDWADRVAAMAEVLAGGLRRPGGPERLRAPP